VASPSKRLRALADEIPDDRALRANLLALDDLNGAFSDHAIALMGASIAEKALEVAILSQFVDLSTDERQRLFDYDKRGPLSDLSAKIKIGYAIGIYGKSTREDLDKVRQIRNAFAHTLQLVTFDTPTIADLCASLHMPETSTVLSAYTSRDNAKRRYIETVLVVAERVKSSTINPARPKNTLGSLTPANLMRWRLLP
jgi:Mannitol repressor